MVDTVGNQGAGSPVGERLRLAREAKGISLIDIASQTRIPIRHLEHIERGEWDALPAATYSVGFARSYATVVGLDPAEVGQELRQELGIARIPTASPAAAYYEPADPARVPPRSIALITAILIVLLVAGYMMWRSRAVGDAPEDQQLVEAQAPAPSQQVQAQPQAAAPATGPVVLTATEDVWLRVSDGKATPALYQDILKAGARYEVPATAAAPQLRTSRPQALRVTVGNVVIPQLGPPEKLLSNVSLKAADLAARAQGQPGPTNGTPPAAATP